MYANPESILPYQENVVNISILDVIVSYILQICRLYSSANLGNANEIEILQNFNMTVKTVFLEEKFVKYFFSHAPNFCSR